MDQRDRSGPPGETVADVGELALVRRVLSGLGPDARGTAIGPGDDSAVLEPMPGPVVVTTDSQREGVHFRTDWIDAATIGRRALAVNVSDIAAMGAHPRWALCAIGLPADTLVSWVDELVSGMREGGREFECPVVGGDVSQVRGAITITVSAGGELPPGQPALTRSGSRPGDECWITGYPGRAAAGRRLLEAGVRDDPNLDDARLTCLRSYARPAPPLSLAAGLAGTGVVRAGMDVSDGLGMDVMRLCSASGVGVELDAVALRSDPVLCSVAGEVGLDSLELAIAGGDDYELLLAVSPGGGARLRELAVSLGVDLRRVGVFTEPERGGRLRDGDRESPLQGRGWDHFGAGSLGSGRSPSRPGG